MLSFIHSRQRIKSLPGYSLPSTESGSNKNSADRRRRHRRHHRHFFHDPLTPSSSRSTPSSAHPRTSSVSLSSIQTTSQRLTSSQLVTCALPSRLQDNNSNSACTRPALKRLSIAEGGVHFEKWLSAFLHSEGATPVYFEHCYFHY